MSDIEYDSYILMKLFITHRSCQLAKTKINFLVIITVS